MINALFTSLANNTPMRVSWITLEDAVLSGVTGFGIDSGIV